MFVIPLGRILGSCYKPRQARQGNQYNLYVHSKIVVAVKLDYLERGDDRFGTIELVPPQGKYFPDGVTVSPFDEYGLV